MVHNGEMSIKLIRRSLFLFFAIATAFGGGWLVGSRSPLTGHAQTTYREYHLDKSWGELKGSMGSFLLFEHEKGDVRLVNTRVPNPMNAQLAIEMLLTRQ